MGCTKLLSVIIPCYNVEEFIVECIESIYAIIGDGIKNQVELIIVVDGATDNTLSLVNEFNWGEGDQIHIVNQINGGLSSARNKGLSIATGKYIAFLDSDDVWLPKMKGLLDELKFIDCDVIEFNAIRFTGGDNPYFSESIYKYILNNKVIDDELSVGLYRDIVFEHSQWMVWSRFFKRNLIGDVRFPIGKTYEDIIFTSSMYRKAKSFFVYRSDCIGYRINPMSITSKTTFLDQKSMLWVMEQAKDMFIHYNDKNTYHLLVNSYLFYKNILNGLKVKDANLHEVEALIKNDFNFKSLPLSNRLRFNHDRAFYTIKNILVKIKSLLD